ncbi:hypothetical protein AX769_05800 [Frondihabitans sp. PAMC 28766]|uniref:hypothetical protein n=1 Tax=Frondihabitans sp. PAMC 28766 TaxID=1795630 RepID=UPI00078E2E54|nr:hypothetical protein [Frondihabitans sp. PAMC 28766]AMM19751.1 hypothetical protein AX769_05800 [Frondihabitans sp. PAMC 28766]
MDDFELDAGFAAAVRAELVAVGTKTSGLRRHQRRTRLAAVGIAAIAAAATMGAALVVHSFPGSTTVAPIGTAVTVTRTGTATIQLGTPAYGANTVIIDVTCVSDTGNISVPSTSGFSQDAAGKATWLVTTGEWNCATRKTTVHIKDGYLAPGSTSITVTADPGTTWKAVAKYGDATTSAWGVNAHGQTYGAPNGKSGFPDLEGAQATNGKIGFIYAKESDAFMGTGCINVYKSDGTTVIGKFGIGTTTCGSDPAATNNTDHNK